MTSIKLIVSGASARAEVTGILTSGMVGIPITITYDSAWDGLRKTLVCRGGCIARSKLDVGESATVAPEVMVANAILCLGVEGRNADGTLVIPTVWAKCGTIIPGANGDADPSADPTLPVWAQVIEQAVKLASQAGNTKDAVETAAGEAESSRQAAAASAEDSEASAQSSAEAAQAAASSAASAEASATAASTSEAGAAKSAGTATGAAQAAQDAANKAALSAAAAQTALQGMVYVTFAVDADGHVLIRNGDLLGSTAFSLTPAGHLEVNY